MKNDKVEVTEIADAIGYSPIYVRKILNGSYRMTGQFQRALERYLSYKNIEFSYDLDAPSPAKKGGEKKTYILSC